jgi:uncharacterized protein (TIGR02145 family)
MKKRQNYSTFLLLMSVFLVFAFSCEKDDENNDLNNTFKDSRDGTVYKTVTIGKQVWMAENLNYETDSGCWVYDNDPSFASTNGRLYNWETAQKVCPSGWHLPSDDEWKELEDFISGEGHSGTEGTALKATSGWYNNGNGTDDYGFKAIASGNRMYNGDNYDFYSMGQIVLFWTSTGGDSNLALNWTLVYHFEHLERGINDKSAGFSVRCVRD